MAVHGSQFSGVERERAVRGFQGILHANMPLARRRGAGIERQINAFVEDKSKQHRDGVILERALCEVGREVVLDPAWACAPSNMHVSPDSVPAGLDCFVARVPRLLTNREARALERGSVFDPGVDRKLTSITQHIQRLTDGGHDVAAMTGVEAYALSLHLYWSQGKYPQSRFLNELDPDLNKSATATPVMAIFAALGEELNAPSTVIRTREEWMDLGIRILFAFDPEFDGSQIGFREPLPWRRSDHEEYAAFDRKWLQYLMTMGGRGNDAPRDLVQLLARATEALAEFDLPEIVQQFSTEPEQPTAATEKPTAVAEIPRPAWLDVQCTGLPLRGWNKILAAAGRKPSDKYYVRKMNKQTHGPIVYDGMWPVADAAQLRAWMAWCGDQLQAKVDQQRREQGTMNALEEPDGFALDDLKMHLEKRPNAKGKARPAADSPEDDEV